MHKKTTKELAADVEWLSAMLANQFALPIKVKGIDAQLANIIARLERLEAAQARVRKKVKRANLR